MTERESRRLEVCTYTKSRVKTCLENHSQNVPMPTPTLHYGPIFQSAIHETWLECFYIPQYKGQEGVHYRIPSFTVRIQVGRSVHTWIFRKTSLYISLFHSRTIIPFRLQGNEWHSNWPTLHMADNQTILSRSYSSSLRQSRA